MDKNEIENKKILEIISNETKDTIDSLSIVTPSMYATIFTKHAIAHEQTLENEHDLACELLNIECIDLHKLQEQTSKNVSLLSTNTSRAISAIKEQNTSILDTVLHETEKLRLEVEKLKSFIYKDELTHTYNRKWMHDHYTDTTDTMMITDGYLALIDLNDFKEVNDTHGHIIGDKVLIFIASQLKKVTKNIIRYGGDEFVLFFDTKNSLEQLQEQMKDLQNQISSKKLKAHDTTFHTSFSFGIAPFHSGDQLAHVIQEADNEMYQNKQLIKNS